MAQQPSKGRIVHYTNRRRPETTEEANKVMEAAIAVVKAAQDAADEAGINATDDRQPEQIALEIEIEWSSPDLLDAAIITGTNEDGTVDLTVEYRGGARLALDHVKYFDGGAGFPEARGCWSWPVQVR